MIRCFAVVPDRWRVVDEIAATFLSLLIAFCLAAGYLLSRHQDLSGLYFELAAATFLLGACIALALVRFC